MLSHMNLYKSPPKNVFSALHLCIVVAKMTITGIDVYRSIGTHGAKGLHISKSDCLYCPRKNVFPAMHLHMVVKPQCVYGSKEPRGIAQYWIMHKPDSSHLHYCNFYLRHQFFIN